MESQFKEHAMDDVQPRRSTRKRRLSYTPGQLSDIAQDQFVLGFDNFDVSEKKSDNSDQDCQATILYRIPPRGRWRRIEGSTGEGHGHAEMDALHKLWVGVCGEDFAIYSGYSLAVECLAKPCCCRCSAVLGLLGISATKGTYKTRATMGSTEWGVSREVRELLARVTSQPADAFYDLGSQSFAKKKKAK